MFLELLPNFEMQPIAHDRVMELCGLHHEFGQHSFCKLKKKYCIHCIRTGELNTYAAGATSGAWTAVVCATAGCESVNAAVAG